MASYEIYAWEPTVSPHKLALFRALRDSGRVDRVVYVAQADLSEGRKRQGWSRGDIDDLDIRIAPSAAEINALVSGSSPDAIHIFSGVHWSPVLQAGLEAVQATRRRFGLMREPRASEGIRGLGRLLHSWLTEGAYRARADFVLAIGRNGPPWFRWAGYPRRRIFPFAYFLPMPGVLPQGPSRDAPPLVVYLGRLDAEKGVQLWLDALPLTKVPARFAIAGAGALAPIVEARSRGPGPTIEVLGPIPMAEAAELLATADVVCAPSISTNDGWCAVVSEALMAGAAVVTTKKVGASICVDQDSRLGRVVDVNAAHVASAIDDVLQGELLTRPVRAWRKAWADQRLTAEAGAATLLKILDHLYQGKVRPEPFYV